VTVAGAPSSNSVSTATQKNSSLLFQFILSEFIEAYEETRKLNLLCTGTEEVLPLPPNIFCQFSGNQPDKKVQNILLKLLGESRGGINHFSWEFADGLLNKMHAYCMSFDSEPFEKEIIAMQHYVEKVRFACVSALEAINKNAAERRELLAAIDKITQAMQRLSKLMARMIQKFPEDENVIFFILRHRIQLDKLYGHRFVLKTINRMYSKGLSEVQQLLLKKFTRRGFENVLPMIHSLISEFDSELAL
jgi:hypothetical protein